MAGLTPKQEEWSRLYQAAIQVKALAPWEWLEEDEVFGVQDPETGELGFVSVMGILGEHFSVAVYLGARALYEFWTFHDMGTDSDADDLVKIAQLQASFEDRNILTDKDRAVIKQLGLKFRGRQAWPMFRSWRPGYFPWYLEAQEARFLTHVLEQTLHMAPRIREDRTLLVDENDEHYLVRVPRKEKKTQVWEDRYVRVPPPEPSSIRIPMDVEALEQLQSAPRSRARLEIDLFLMPILLGERGQRPQCAYMLLVVDGDSGFVLGSEVLGPDPTLEAVYAKVPVHVVYAIARLGSAPREVWIRSPLLARLMKVLADELGFAVIYSDELPALDGAREFLTERFL